MDETEAVDAGVSLGGTAAGVATTGVPGFEQAASNAAPASGRITMNRRRLAELVVSGDGSCDGIGKAFSWSWM
jgi:hypothetical protein